MYKDNFVVSIKSDGKFLRDYQGMVKLPFGSEYSIYLKNLENRLATVKIWIDGEDVLDGNSLIIHSNQPFTLEGYMKGNQALYRFKFIEKTKQIESYRGNRPEDGLIRVEYRFQEQYPTYTVYTTTTYYDWQPVWKYNASGWNTFSDSSSSVGGRGSCSSSYSYDNNSNISCYYSSLSNNVDNCDGISVKGSPVQQNFQAGYAGNLENTVHVMTFALSGYHNEKKVEKSITTKDKIICMVCGNPNKYNAKYCNNCGNCLV